MSGSRDAAIIAQQLLVIDRTLNGYRQMLEIARQCDMVREIERIGREIIETENAAAYLRTEQRRLTR